MKRRQFIKSLGLAGASLLAISCSKTLQKPNIVFIMADDMGYGDPGCYNPESKAPTPNIDQLAGDGMRFTNAHSAGSLCIPARYGLLTGRYPMRDDMNKHRYTNLIEPGRETLATVLKKSGYRTAMVGKWHLGFEHIDDPDFSKPLKGGPVDCGFDSFFGMHASLDIQPYYYIENDRAVPPPTEPIEAHNSPDVTPIQGEFWRAGKVAPGFKHDEVLGKFTEKSISFIEKQGNDVPFFLYLALAAPHTPWLPRGKFRGMSKAGDYGDFVSQVDDAVGQVLKKLKDMGFADNTLVFFTSDNGPVWFDQDIERYDHRSVYFLRGMKADAYEGGHRMPFIARWPGKVKAGTVSNEVISFTDMLATFADVAGTELIKYAEDSYSIVPELLGRNYQKPLREATVIDNNAIIQWPWKLIIGSGLGGIHTRYSTELQAIRNEGKDSNELYNLETDRSETKNLAKEHPEIVERLEKLLNTYREQGFSVSR